MPDNTRRNLLLGIATIGGTLAVGMESAAGVTDTEPSANYVAEGSAFADLGKQPGVDLTGTTECGTAMQAALDGVLAFGARAYARGTVKTSTTLMIKGDCDLSDLVVNYTGQGIAVQVGDSTVRHRRRIALPHISCKSKPETGWKASTIGVKIVNIQSSNIIAPRIHGFETGLLMYGNGQGVVYNSVFIGHLDNNKRNMVLDADATGWSNQNIFIGGRYAHESAEGTAVSGTRHILCSTTAHPVNGNTWLSPSVEGIIVEFMIDVDGGCYNAFEYPRLESRTGGKVRWGATAHDNVIQGGYAVDTTTVTNVAGAVKNVIRGINRFEVRGGGNAAILRLQNSTSDANAAAAIFPSDSTAEADYRWSFSGNSINGKRKADTTDRLRFDATNGRIHLGPGGSTALSMYLTSLAANNIFSLNGGHLSFNADNTWDLGYPSFRPRDLLLGRNAVIGGALVHNGSKVGFYGVEPTARPSAYTNTYAKAGRTLSAYTANVQSSAYTGKPSSSSNTAKLADLNALRLAYEKLRTFTEDLAQQHNSLIADLKTLGLLQ